MNASIGKKLRKEREAQDLTIDQVASSTRIRAHYLSALESGEWEQIPSAAQARGFLRAYADFLRLDADLLLGELPDQEPPADQPAPASVSSAPAPEAEPFKRSEEIFADVGQQLRRQRELLGLSLEDVERHTFLRQHYLTALEAGDLGGLPSPVQGRGMLDNYASFLGMNSEALLLRFAEGLQAQLDVRRGVDVEAVKPAPTVEAPVAPSRLRGLLSPDILIGGSMLIFLGVFIIWGGIRIFNEVTGVESTPTAPSIAEVLLATSTPGETPTPEPATPTGPSSAQLFPTFPVATGTLPEGAAVQGASPVQVYLTIRQRAWMRVTVDGQVEFEGRVIPGSAYPFIGQHEVQILTGNGAALQVFFNGVDFGPMGSTGQIVNQIFTPQGILTPTPTPAPTSAGAPAATTSPLVETPTAAP